MKAALTDEESETGHLLNENLNSHVLTEKRNSVLQKC